MYCTQLPFRTISLNGIPETLEAAGKTIHSGPSNWFLILSKAAGAPAVCVGSTLEVQREGAITQTYLLCPP